MPALAPVLTQSYSTHPQRRRWSDPLDTSMAVRLLVLRPIARYRPASEARLGDPILDLDRWIESHQQQSGRGRCQSFPADVKVEVRRNSIGRIRDCRAAFREQENVLLTHLSQQRMRRDEIETLLPAKC
jgi:hypothetical protein